MRKPEKEPAWKSRSCRVLRCQTWRPPWLFPGHPALLPGNWVRSLLLVVIWNKHPRELKVGTSISHPLPIRLTFSSWGEGSPPWVSHTSHHPATNGGTYGPAGGLRELAPCSDWSGLLVKYFKYHSLSQILSVRGQKATSCRNPSTFLSRLFLPPGAQRLSEQHAGECPL